MSWLEVIAHIPSPNLAPILSMEQHALKNINNCLNTNIHSYLETSGGQSSNLYLYVANFFNASVN